MTTAYAAWGMNKSTNLRLLALEAAQRASADLDNPKLGKELGRDGKTLTFTPHALETVILSATALEAGINEMAAWIRLGFLGEHALPEDFVRQRPTDKWAMVPRLLAGAEFDRGRSPWQDFSTLVKLRDQLVHFKWHGEAPPDFMRALQARDLCLPERPSVYWVDAALTDRVAKWAVATTDSMFEELARLLGRLNDPAWPWQ